MKIALIGYGKMGRAIEEIALEKGHEIVLKIDLENNADFTKENLQKAEAAIEFTGPHSAFENVDHFGKINEYLKELKKEPIMWQVE